jgi:L-alanine-DL-glutamate epimerase-like enolase superfamily enzyme
VSAPRRGPGRPPGTQYGAKLAPLAVSPVEKAAIEAAAKAANLPVAEWLRRAAAYCVATRVPLTHLTVD